MKTGQQNLSFEIDVDCVTTSRIACKNDAFDASFREQYCVTAHDSFAGQNPAVHQCSSHYRVSVILHKWGG